MKNLPNVKIDLSLDDLNHKALWPIYLHMVYIWMSTIILKHIIIPKSQYEGISSSLMSPKVITHIVKLTLKVDQHYQIILHGTL
ncbi:Uncharacterized protein TCM_002934 [Theobroma cacao]|uniref:Uncharacterized protein n=1 Tax=Theobroma cacao TaxID=3641 RepID=A0A061DM87_THECC|nr:Uncharacterized protein TCM_002934 [Theobroma cacao]